MPSFDVPYAITRRLERTNMTQARERVVSALGAEGFGVLTEIDVQSTLKRKLDVDFAPYLILGACNPSLAHRALEREPAIGLLLPCNVVLTQVGEDVIVSAASPRAMLSAAVDADAVREIADEAEQRLRRVIERT